MKVIAVCGSAGFWTPGKSAPYEAALRQAGVEPLFISPSDPPPATFSGLLLMGGSDVNPALYGEAHHPETGPSDDARDRLELALIEDAVRRDVPILAICRGAQILNVQHGGTLVQHLAATARHRVKAENPGKVIHSVEVERGSRLASIVGEPSSLDVNSRHHQAIARAGHELRITARDPEDGTIEAVERTDRRFVIGVQWHPENQANRDVRQAKLFQEFAAAARSRD